MTVQDWTTIAELVGAVAIVVTLAYLAMQIRLARIASTDEARHHRVAAIRELSSWIISNSEMRTAWDNVQDPSLRHWIESYAQTHDISYDEANLVIWKGTCWVWAHWAQFRAITSPADRRELQNIVSVFYSVDPMRTLMADDNFRAYFDPSFVAWIDKVVDGGR